MATLQETCAELRRHINTARLESAPMVDEATNLIVLKGQVQSKQRMLANFNTHFLLSDEEMVALTSSAEPVTDDFFQTLVKAKKIRKDCQVLLGGENQRLGLEILEQSTKYLNAAFQKLFRWSQREFKMLDLENPHVSFLVRRALRVLAERPASFQDCLDSFAEVRERTLSDAFQAALTGSAADRDRQKPIEFSAHEPLRYVGDMLAWAHSTAVSERESLEVLFVSEGNEIAKSIEEGLESEPWLRPETGEIFDGKRALGQLVNRNLAGVAELLHRRIDQVLRTHNEPILDYKIGNLVVFYRTIFEKLLEEDDFIQTLNELEDAAIAQFRSRMKEQVTSTQRDMDLVPASLIPDDLGSPDFLDECLAQLQHLLKSYDTSAVMADTEGEGLALVLGEALDPFLACCDELAKTLDESEDHCFGINCKIAARSTLANFGFTEYRITQMNETIEEHATQLVDSQVDAFLHKSGLHPLLEALPGTTQPEEAAPALLSHEAFTPDNLLAARQSLDEFLPSALTDAISELKGLKNSTLAHEIANRAAERFCEEFETIEAAIDASSRLQRLEADEVSDVPTMREAFPRTSEEIRILLS